MIKQTLQRGFTLIELLVVIAIIGILAAVVIGSLNDARSSGQNASIQQSMANIRSQAEIVYNSDGYTYDNVCSDGRVTNLISASLDVVNGTDYDESTTVNNADNGADSTSRVAACESNDTGYVAITPLAGGSNFWCVDSTGASGQASTTFSSDGVQECGSL